MKKLLMIAMVAIFATVACTKTDPPKPDNKPSVSVSVTPAEVIVGAKAVFTVNAAGTVDTDLTIAIATDKADVLTVPATIVLKKGEKAITFEGTAKAEGSAKITISCAAATIKTAEATVKVVKEVAAANEMKATVPTLTYSTATGAIQAIVNLTLTTAVDFEIEFKTGYSNENWGWTNDAEGYPTGVTWSEHPVKFPAGATEHSFALIIEQGNAGTLPLQLISLKGSKAKDILFEPTEFDFVITK